MKDKKMTKEELVELLIENFTYEEGVLDLSDLDFSEFNGEVYLTDMKVKGNLKLSGIKVEGNLNTSYSNVGGNLYQRQQTVEGNVFQEEHKVGGNLKQHGHYVGGDLDQYYQEVLGDLDQNNTTCVKGIVNNDMTEQSWEHIDKIYEERYSIEENIINHLITNTSYANGKHIIEIEKNIFLQLYKDKETDEDGTLSLFQNSIGKPFVLNASEWKSVEQIIKEIAKTDNIIYLEKLLKKER